MHHYFPKVQLPGLSVEVLLVKIRLRHNCDGFIGYIIVFLKYGNRAPMSRNYGNRIPTVGSGDMVCASHKILNLESKTKNSRKIRPKNREVFIKMECIWN